MTDNRRRVSTHTEADHVDGRCKRLNWAPHTTIAVYLQQLSIYYYYKNKNWLQFLLIVKAAVLKQQISKFYPQIQRTEASDTIYFSQRPFINVKAIFCA